MENNPLNRLFYKTHKQQRCNGDEMQWYLFYSKPNYLDEFCTVSY